MFRRGFGWVLMTGGLAALGCGSSLHPVTGVVTMNGAAVPGANVTFVSEDGSKTYSALTDAEGKFTVTTGDQAGVAAGTYKVLVIKNEAMAGTDNLKPSDPEYAKLMEKGKKQAEQAARAANMPTGGGGMRPPPGMMPGSTTAVAPTSELPMIYASAATTPLNATVPLATSPLAIELKSNSPKK